MLDQRPQREGPAVPVLTMFACAVTVALFGFNLWLRMQHSGPESTFQALGSGEAADVWSGKYWLLVTCAFVHLEPLHLLFNLYAIWLFGAAMEQHVGPERWLVFVVLAAFVSSATELALGNPCIGLSGVAYALFGFGWLSRDRVTIWERTLNDQLVQSALVWLVGCIAGGVLFPKLVHVANGAHVGGMLFGMGVAAIFVRREKLFLTVPALLLLLGACAFTARAAPWTSSWSWDQGVKASQRGDNETAIRHYRQALRQGAEPRAMWHNLFLVYSRTHDEQGQAEALSKLRALDPADARRLTGEAP